LAVVAVIALVVVVAFCIKVCFNGMTILSRLEKRRAQNLTHDILFANASIIVLLVLVLVPLLFSRFFKKKVSLLL
jgi:hypothetical protein